MVKTTTARQIAELAEIIRFNKQDDWLQVEYRKNGRLRLLTQIRFGRLASGRPTKRLMDCLDNGVPKTYDKGYDFEVTAFLNPSGSRVEV